MTLPDSMISPVIAALHLAARQYDDDAHTASCLPAQWRIEDQFKRQAKEVREVIAFLETQRS